MIAADVELPPAQQTVVRVISEDAATAVAKAACSNINKAISLYVCSFFDRFLPTRVQHLP
jgi:hypothetical protein